MSKVEYDSVLKFKLQHVYEESDQDQFSFDDFLHFAKQKQETCGLNDKEAVTLLVNDISDLAKKTYDFHTAEYEQRVEKYFEATPNKDEGYEESPLTDYDNVVGNSLDNDPTNVLDNDDLRKRERYDLASEIIADGFKEQHDVRTIFNDDDRRMFFYEDGVFKENAESKVDQYTRAALGQAHKPTISQRVTAKVKADTYVDEDVLFDVEPGLLCLENGVLDLHSRELREHSPNLHQFQKLDVEYDPSASYYELKEFLEGLVASEDDVKLLQEIFGYCLYREYFIKKAVIFHGDADNGKSTVINILQRLLGDGNISGVKLQELNKRFQKRWLVHKYANIVGDLDSKEIKQTGDFKALTGGDPLQYEVKNGGAYTFTNYAKLIYSANKLPKVRNPTPAFFSRWIIVNFPYTFVEPSEYERRKDEDGVKKAKNNPVDELFEEQGLRLSGALNFALDGLQRLLDNGEFSYTKSRQENMVQWVRQSSSFQAFCMDCVREEPNRFITKEQMRDAYRKYCKQHNLTHEKDSKFKKDHLRDYFGVAEKRPSVGGKQKRSWMGIRFKDEFQKSWHNLNKAQSKFILRDKESEENVGEASEQSLVTYDDFKQTLSELSQDADGNITKQSLKERVGVKDEERFQEFLEKAKQDGDVYEPTQGEVDLI